MADGDSTRSDAVHDIHAGLGLLATLANLLNDATADEMTGNELTAAAALAQKTGAILERGARNAGLLEGPGICGVPEEWLRH